MICSKSNCTGCFACYNICPKNAIEMVKDEYGNVFPHIDKKKCINCGMCRKNCPQLNDKMEFYDSIAAYALYNKDEKKEVKVHLEELHHFFMNMFLIILV